MKLQRHAVAACAGNHESPGLRPAGQTRVDAVAREGRQAPRVPAHHKFEEYLDAAQLWEEKCGPLLRSTKGKTKKLAAKRMTRRDVYDMVRWRAKDAAIETAIWCHTFRATGITNYLMNGGTLEKAQQLANHESARTT